MTNKGHRFQPDPANRTKCDICGRNPKTAAHEAAKK